MVVNEDERRRCLSHSLAKDLARMHQARCQRSLRDHDVAHHAMTAVEQQDMKAFGPEVTQAREVVSMDILGALDARAPHETPSGEAPADLAGRQHRGGLHRAHAWNRRQLLRVGASRTLQATELPQQRLGDVPNVMPAATRAQQQRKELGVGERPGTQTLQPLARTVVSIAPLAPVAQLLKRFAVPLALIDLAQGYIPGPGASGYSAGCPRASCEGR